MTGLCVLLLQLVLIVKRNTEMLAKIKIFSKTKWQKVTEAAAYKAFRKKREKLGEAILAFLLQFFDSISPVCSVLCLKTTNREKAIASRNEISLAVI